MTKPIITVVTPSFNQARYLPECLESVAIQQLAPIEHIVNDGGSSDESARVLARFAGRHRYLRWSSERDNGQSHALNKGFREAKGEFIGWLNADDRYRSGCLSALLQVFQDHPEIDVVYGDYTWMDADGRTIQMRREISFSRFVLMYHRVLYIPTTAMMFRRRILDAGHFLNETLHYAMDFEYLLRLSTLGFRFMHVSGILADFRFHPDSKSSQFADRQLDEQDKIMRQYSPILHRYSQPWLSRPLEHVLRASAAARRYGEKAMRGYYFSQFRTVRAESQ